MLRLLHEAELHAASDIPILVTGETGVGKELLARAIHRASRRAKGPFVPVNMLALSPALFESEFFGHVKGAFTGADKDKVGYLGKAAGGTLFLDEIGELPQEAQVKLLRVIQEKTYMPVGGEKSVRADVRVICATNKDLKQLTSQGRFRSDLYYRLAVMPINLPPLRDRGRDISLLADFFLDKFSGDTGKKVKEISPEALELLIRYSWPGNVRELGNAIQYAMVKCRGGLLDVEHLPPEIRESSDTSPASKAGRPPKLDLETVREALRTTRGNRSETAKMLGVSRTTLYRFLDKNEVLQNTNV